MTGVGLRHLAALDRLKHLSYRGSPGSTDLSPLREWPALESLNIADATIGDAVLGTLGDVPWLKSLTLRASSISDDGLLRIRALATLEELDLQNTKITDRGLPHLVGLESLRVLVLGNIIEEQLITEGGLRVLAALPSLEQLDVSRVELQSGAFDELAAIPSLKRLNFNMKRREMLADWQRLQHARPDVEKSAGMINVRAFRTDLPSFGDIDVVRN